MNTFVQKRLSAEENSISSGGNKCRQRAKSKDFPLSKSPQIQITVFSNTT
jgi:hypothetical protein